VNATWRFLVFGTQPLGALIGGVLGGLVGLRTTIVVGSLGMLASTCVAATSPIGSLKSLPRAA
ncbi:MAG: MFS transporter, partial [bacterium]